MQQAVHIQHIYFSQHFLYCIAFWDWFIKKGCCLLP